MCQCKEEARLREYIRANVTPKCGHDDAMAGCDEHRSCEEYRAALTPSKPATCVACDERPVNKVDFGDSCNLCTECAMSWAESGQDKPATSGGSGATPGRETLHEDAPPNPVARQGAERCPTCGFHRLIKGRICAGCAMSVANCGCVRPAPKPKRGKVPK